MPETAKAMDGVKILESQPRGTPRRMGIGTFAQPNMEQERSVCAPAFWPQARQPAVPGKRRGR